MALDAYVNFGKVTLDSGISAGATSMTLQAGDEDRLPTLPANFTIYNATDYGDPSDDPDREIGRATSETGGVVQITRAQEGTTAVAHNTAGKTYKAVFTLTKKFFEDLLTTFQGLDATLTAFAAVTVAADKLVYATGSDAFATTDLSSFARTFLDDANASAVRTTLGLVIGTDVQAYDAELAAIAGLSSAADRLAYFTGSGTAALTTFTSFGRSLVDDADAATARATLGLEIGVNVQAWDADLDTWATKTAPSGTVVGTSDAQSLTNKKLGSLTSNGFVKTSGGDGTLSVDTSTYLTGNQTITLSGDVSGSGATAITTAIGNDKITEAMLKAVDAANDEDILTYEATTGDFEWHSSSEIKTAMSLNNVENTALSTWAGTTNIVTVGTIGTGTWNATTIAVAKGGTGLTTFGGTNRVLYTTSADTLASEAAFTYDAATNTLAVDNLTLSATGLTVGSSVPFSDSAGTLTLQNVDALDATTESTIEAAIDTLANLTSVQGHTVTLTGAFIRSGAHSLTLTTTNTTAVTLPTTGTLSTLSGTETLSGKTLTAPKFASGGFIADANGNELLIFTTTASAVNEITFANGDTGVNPKFTASGETNVGIDFQAKGTGVYRFLATASQAAELRLYEDTDEGSHFTAFKVGAQAGDITYTLPTDDGDPGEVLGTNGSGVLSWVAAGGVPTAITVADEATDTTCFIGFFTAATGDLGPKTNAGLTFNSNTGVFTSSSAVLTTADINGGTLDGVVIGGASAAAATFTTIAGTTLTLTDAASITKAGLLLTLTNSTDAASSQVAILQGDRATPAANDEAYLSLRLSDSAGNQTEYARITWVGTTVTDSSEAGRLDFSVMIGGTLNKELELNSVGLSPFGDDGLALGNAGRRWSDLFLAEGAVINWDNGDVTITQTGNVLSFAGAATRYEFDANICPTSSDGAALGTTALMFSDLFLASGAVLNFDNGNAAITHSSGILTVSTGDLRVTNAGANSASVVTVGGSQTLTSKTLTSPTLTTPSAFTTGGTITLAENTSIALDPAGSADGKYTGITVTATAGYTQAFGDLVYLDPTDSRWEAADGNSAAGADGDARGILGMVVVAGTDGNACTILLQGIIRADAKFPGFTINNPVYVSETAGSVTQTQPTTTDVVIRVVGFALTADEMYFNPSPDYITHT